MCAANRNRPRQDRAGFEPVVDFRRYAGKILKKAWFGLRAERRGAMPAEMNPAPAISTPCDLHEQLRLANLLYREFQSRCFWHSPRDLVITEELIPFVVKGLRTYGGHRGFKLAGRLQPSRALP
jgi:hypothetical protein